METRLDKPARLIWPFVRVHKGKIALALCAICVAAASILVFGWGLKNLIDRGFSDATGTYLNQALLVLLGIVTLTALAAYTRFYTVYWIAERTTADLRKAVFEKLLTLDPSYFDRHKSGEDVSRISADTTVLQMVVATSLPVALRHLLTLAGAVAMLFVVSVPLTLMTLLVVPAVVGPIVFFGRGVRARSRDTQARVGDIAAFSHEALQGIQTIQSFCYEPHAARVFGGFVDRTFGAALKYIRLRAFLTAYVISIVFSAISLVLWAGGHKVVEGHMTAGSLSAFVFYAIMVAGAVTSLTEALGAFSQAAGAADRIGAILGEKPVLAGADALPSVRGDVGFDGVTFSYPSRAGQHSLHGVSFGVKAGEVVALVGPSGAGKTTIFQLLQRFYDPQGGTVTIDGADISQLSPREVRRHMTVVSQDPAVFSVSVAENIRVGKPDATDDEVHRAAELAQAHEFISALPQGYDTPVGERGSRLSGGQKQRLAIARAILKDAKILLLDEATSALDSSNELAVHMALKNLMKGRTTLIIAHRLSTVQGADRILVLDKGRIVAEGTHLGLYGKDPLYTHLAGLQLDAKSA